MILTSRHHRNLAIEAKKVIKVFDVRHHRLCERSTIPKPELRIKNYARNREGTCDAKSEDERTFCIYLYLKVIS